MNKLIIFLLLTYIGSTFTMTSLTTKALRYYTINFKRPNVNLKSHTKQDIKKLLDVYKLPHKNELIRKYSTDSTDSTNRFNIKVSVRKIISRIKFLTAVKKSDINTVNLIAKELDLNGGDDFILDLAFNNAIDCGNIKLADDLLKLGANINNDYQDSNTITKMILILL